ncbi:hypothetical protein Dip518_000510 [Parelusimicrobium proximum]
MLMARAQTRAFLLYNLLHYGKIKYCRGRFYRVCVPLTPPCLGGEVRVGEGEFFRPGCFPSVGTGGKRFRPYIIVFRKIVARERAGIKPAPTTTLCLIFHNLPCRGRFFTGPVVSPARGRAGIKPAPTTTLCLIFHNLPCRGRFFTGPVVSPARGRAEKDSAPTTLFFLPARWAGRSR